jgi:hypothetical protein
MYKYNYLFDFCYAIQNNKYNSDPGLAWSSYDRTWYSGPDKQEVFFLNLNPGLADHKLPTGIGLTFTMLYKIISTMICLTFAMLFKIISTI